MALLIAQMHSYSEVAEAVSQEFKVPESRENVYRFTKTQRARKLIPFLRMRFLNNIMRIPIANKSVRLERLQKVYREAMTESLKSRGQFGDVYELKLGAAIEALKAAREEVEGSSKQNGIRIGDNAKFVFQDITIEEFKKLPVEEKIAQLNNRLSAQFTGQ